MQRRGFTILDVMITITVLAILAAVVVPVLSSHLDRAQQSAAEATYANVRKSIDLYYQEHQRWPSTLDPSLFKPAEAVDMPRGFQLHYTPGNGALELIVIPEDLADEAPDVVLAD
ncbi:MAG: prepilin-type N-terminal cleavage/methylation domain-containing protein [Planctomycetota bacterium]